MAEQQVDILEPEAAQRGAGALHDVLAGQALGVGRGAAGAEEDLEAARVRAAAAAVAAGWIGSRGGRKRVRRGGGGGEEEEESPLWR